MKIKNIELKISELHKQKLFRPTSVAILHTNLDNSIKYLLTQSPKDIFSWNFPQGGINKRESIKESLVRELYEELGIKKKDIEILNLNFFRSKIDFKDPKFNKDRFVKGKYYFYNFVKYNGRLELDIDEKEVSNYLWLNFNKAYEFLGLGEPKKGNLSQKALFFSQLFSR